MKLKTKDLALCALFAALIAVCAWISIPATVPFTLQTFAIFAALGLLGGKRGTVAVAVYLLLGAIGVPVFAVIYMLVREYVEGRLQKKGAPVSTEYYYHMNCTDDLEKVTETENTADSEDAISEEELEAAEQEFWK